MNIPTAGRAFPRAFNHNLTRQFSSSTRQHADFTHVVIGAGAVGLSIANRLALRSSTLLLEKHGSVGTETSSRNSEIIHAGLYYGLDSLKTRLCLKGKEMMYDFCRSEGVAHRNTKKWIVAQDDQQWEEIMKVHKFAESVGVPTRFVGLQEAMDREPDVRAKAGVLESLSTGIVDSHGLMTTLEGKIQTAGGEIAFHTSVTGIEYLANGEYKIHTKDTTTGEPSDPITTETLINAAGLFATDVNNMLLPEPQHLKPFFAKGTYFSYSAPRPKPNVLVYPAPVPGLGGLGTHLTLDLSNPPRVRFGPDVEWVDSPTDYKPNQSRVKQAIEQIATYLPSIEKDKIGVDYCGIRPKLGKLGATSGKGMQDFVIRKEEGFPGFINLLGIESPGLTSCLAIGEEVETMLYT